MELAHGKLLAKAPGGKEELMIPPSPVLPLAPRGEERGESLEIPSRQVDILISDLIYFDSFCICESI